MAEFEVRNKSIRVRINRKGMRSISRTFPTKKQARVWATQVESAMDNGTWVDPKKERELYISKVLANYIKHMNTIKPWGKSKLAVMKKLTERLDGISIVDITPHFVMTYGERRREDIGPKTLKDELSYFAAAIDDCRTLGYLQLESNSVRDAMRVMSKLGLIGSSKNAGRRLRQGEYERLIDGAKSCGSPWIGPAIQIVRNSAMRMSELHGLYWASDKKDPVGRSYVRFSTSEIFLASRKHPTDKHNNHQTIQMFDEVKEGLKLAKTFTKSYAGRVLPVKDANSIGKTFAKLCKKLDIHDLRFHDLRHEAISLMFEEKGWSIPQVAAVSGHRTWSQLKRYTHLKPGDYLSNKD
tara:strand:- start:2552 stop:3610 length:1059 start_codon:yes stop_codon:yes gene_type:complete